MAVYFYKLFDKITELNITQKELMQRIGASSSTLAKMRNNQTVALDVIVRICDELKCDIGDIVTCVPKKTDVQGINNNTDRLNSIARAVLNEYMSKNNLSIGDVAKITSLSLNTVKSFVNGNNISAASHAKLLRLGERYNESLGKAFGDLMPAKTKKTIYCYSCGKRGNGCWAAQSLWNTEKKENIKVTQLDNGMVHQTVEIVAGEGFVFGLYNTDVITYNGNQKLPANTLMATGSTNKSGKLTFSGYYPHGNYYIQEISVPAGWKLSTQKYPVVLTSANKASGENTIVVELAQPILNELIYTPVTLTKKDITGAETLPGALIEVQDSNGKVIYREYTDKNGQIPNIPVVPGTYTFRETYAPEGYALNTAVMTFNVTADGKVTGDTEIRDEINHVYLKKVRENGDGLMGAVFGLYDAKGTKVQEATSDKDGMVTFSKIGYGSYTIKELTAPYGFHPSQDEWKITIDGTYLNPTKVLSTVTNEDAPGQIQILKLDELDKHPIANVQFDIYETKADGSIGDLISTMTTNDEGVALSAKLLVGDYMVKEHENPTGYESTIWSETITVIMDQVVNRTVTNKPIQGAIRIVKTDSETGKPLAGAQFTITRVKGLPSHNGEDVGEVVGVITSGPDGIAETPLLTWGEYEVKETLIPDDYIDSGYCVTVTIPSAN